jgi:hypothetical protein
MEIPWNVISDKDISLSKSEFTESIKNLKPIYEDAKEIIEKYKKVRGKIFYQLTFLIVLFVTILVTEKLFEYSVLLLIPMNYFLGVLLTYLLNERKYIILTIVYVLLSLLMGHSITKYTLLASIIPLSWGYFANLNEKIYLSWSSYASNLLASWDDIEYRNSDSTIIRLRKGTARISPYRADLESSLTIGKLKVRAFTSVFALRKGRVGYIVVLKVKRYTLLSDKLIILMPLVFGKIKEFLTENFNKKEWELG